MGINISIIVPIYNTPQIFFRNCLESLHKQNLEDLEFILINDGSTEPWIDKIASEFCSMDNRFKYLTKKNTGAADTRNYGIEVCRGDYIMFVDSDDTLSEDACKYALNSIKTSNSDVVILGIGFYPKEQTLIKKMLSKDEHIKLKYSTLAFTSLYREFDLLIDSPCAKIFKSSIIKNNNIKFPVQLKRSEDAMFCLYYYECCEKIYLDNLIIYTYVYNPDSTCHKCSDVSVKALPKVLEEEELFLNNNQNNKILYSNALPERTIKGIQESFSTYFLNKNNNKSEKVLIKELKEFLNIPIVHKYFIKSDFSKIKGKRKRLYWILLRLRLYKQVFVCERILKHLA